MSSGEQLTAAALKRQYSKTGKKVNQLHPYFENGKSMDYEDFKDVVEHDKPGYSKKKSEQEMK